MREIVIGMIWGLGLMAAMLVTVRLYRGDFNRRHLFLFSAQISRARRHLFRRGGARVCGGARPENRPPRGGRARHGDRAPAIPVRQTGRKIVAIFVQTVYNENRNRRFGSPRRHVVSALL